MKRKNATRSALFTSIISLLLCVSMLVGTTFAWFTDSVSSAKNQIVAGNLDVELEYAKVVDGQMTAWATVAGAEDLFDPKALWEPGRVEVAYLKVTNLGTLALKYQLGINVYGETAGINVAGEEFELSDYLVFKAVEMPDALTTYTDRQAAQLASGGTMGLTDYNGTTTALEVEGIDYVALIVYMPESVGNEANYRGTAPTIELGVNLYATQETYEEDSFGDDYDEDAWVDGFDVFDEQDLIAAIANGENNIDLMADIALTNAIEIPKGASVALNLNGKTINNDAGYAFENKGNLVIDGNGTVSGLGLLRSTSGSLTINSGNFYASSRWQDGVYQHTLKAENSNVVINGGNFDATVDGQTNAMLNASAGATITINGGNFKNVAGALTAFDPYIATYEKDGKIVINDGTFYGGWRFNGETTATDIYGGNFNLSYDGQSFHANSTHDVTVYGGTFAADSKFAVNQLNANVATGYKATLANGSYVVTTAETEVVADAAELKQAAKENNATVVLASGTYDMGGTFGIGEGTTLVGNGDVTINGTVSGTLKNVTIQNVTVKGSNAQRWAYASGDVIFENCTFEGTGVYALHYDGTSGANITYKNCTITGWAAIAGGHNSLTFDGCTINGNGTYGVIRVYGDTTIKNCTFDVDNVNTTDVYQDGIHAVECTINVEDCTNVNGAIEDIFNVSGTGVINVFINGVEQITAANASKPVAPLEEDFMFPAGTNAVMYKNAVLSGDAQIVHTEDAVLGLSNVVANLDHDVIVRKSGGAICIENSEFTLTDGAKLISVGEGGDAYQVFLINVKVNGELLTDANAGQYLEGINWFQALPEWPNVG